MKAMLQSQQEKTDVLFVHVPKFSSYYKPLDEFMYINYIPMGIFALCDILNKQGIASKIKHLGLEYLHDNTFSIAEYVQKHAIRIVAMSLHWHYQAYDVIKVARRIKAVSQETTIILGGFTASFFAHEIMRDYDVIDFIIAGDGERGLLELSQALREQQNDFSGIANCLYRKDGKVFDNGITYLADPVEFSEIEYANLSYLDHYENYRDYFKVPLFWLLNVSIQENMRRKISGATSTFPLMVGRGCNVNCSFCGGGQAAQKKICGRERAVFMPIKKVVDTMEQALEYGYESFLICFDPNPYDDGYYLELFEKVRQRKLSCGMGFESWGLPTKRFVEEFGKTFLKKTSYLALSPETNSEELRKLNKGFFYTNDELFRTMQHIEDEGIPMLIYLTMGLAGETSKHIDDNVEFAKALRKRFKCLSNILMLPIQLEPASPLYKDPESYGAITERQSFRDFYDYHKQPESNPYTYLGYVTQTLQEADGDMLQFQEYIHQERCQNFCFLPVKLFGRFVIPALSRFLCTMTHKRWIKRGFGKPPCERRTFQ